MRISIRVVSQIRKSLFNQLDDRAIPFAYNGPTSSFNFVATDVRLFNNQIENVEIDVDKDTPILIHKDNVLSFWVRDETNAS